MCQKYQKVKILEKNDGNSARSTLLWYYIADYYTIEDKGYEI